METKNCLVKEMNQEELKNVNGGSFILGFIIGVAAYIIIDMIDTMIHHD